jgi:flagellar hook-associated protein 2
MLFDNYGAETPTFGTETDDYGDIVKAHSNVTNNDKNLFMFGFELDKNGHLSVDSDTFNDIVNGENENYSFEDLKSVFTGAYENKGLGVQIKDYLDDLDGYEGLLTNYESQMDERKIELEEEKEEEIDRLDAKYGIMAEQFSAYSAIIAQMEASFSGLKMMIEQSTSGN